MSTFKTALRMALAHPFYLLIYTVFISLMGVFIAASVSWNSSQLTEYKPYDANVVVVDRDDSDLSRALTKHLGSRFELVTGIGDDTYDLADALSKSNSAKGGADCVFFIPEGFEGDLVAAARAGETLPVHEFHHWDSTENGDAFTAAKANGRQWACGFANACLYAGFPHLYWAGTPLPKRFAAAAEHYIKETS